MNIQNHNAISIEFNIKFVLGLSPKGFIHKILRRSLSFLLFVSILSFMSCESTLENPNGLRIINPQVSVNFQDSVLIGASSDDEILYDIHDPYIVSIKGDKIIGRHVGSTKITASSNGESEDIEVTVLPISNLFEHPITDYSNGKNFYKEKYANFNLKYEDDTTLVFFVINYDALSANYLLVNFTKENTTKDALLMFPIGSYISLYYSMIEHFEVFEVSENGYLFINALNPSLVTEIATLELDRENQLCYVYITKIEPMVNLADTNAQVKSLRPKENTIIKNTLQKTMSKDFKNMGVR